jgi:hypothetical protein
LTLACEADALLFERVLDKGDRHRHS